MFKYGKFFIQICIIIGLSFSLFAPAWAKENDQADERVHIVASESGIYDLENQMFTASGNVEINYGELRLRGDTLEVNLLSGELKMEGDVFLSQADQEIQGEFLVYNLETGAGSFEEAQAQIPLLDNTEAIFLTGKLLEIADEDKYKVQGAKFTTCDLADSHYHVATKELEVELGKRVIIRGVTYYEGKIPLFYWPYLMIPLDSDDANRFFTFPEFGYGDHEGFYMKNTFNYHFSSKSYGNLYLDIFSRLGAGFGLRHYYDLNKLGKGSFYLYGLPHPTSPVVKGAFKHEWQYENLSLTTDTNYEDSWSSYELSSQNRLSLKLPKLQVETWYNYRENPLRTVKKQEQYGGSWNQNLAQNWRLNLNGTWTERETGENLRFLDYLAETQYHYNRHKFTLAVQQQYNPDLLESTVQPWRSVQRLPEFSWEISDLGIAKIPLRSEIIIGRYEERRPSLVRGNRLLAKVALQPQIWRPTKNSSLSYQTDLTGAAYQEGEKQIWTSSRLTLNQRIKNDLQLNGTYSRRDVWGSTPFRFDEQKPSENLTVRLTYTRPKWRASINSGYNFKTKKFDTLVFQSNARPNENWNFNFYSYYDLERKGFLRIVPMVEYKQDEVDLKLGLRFRPIDQITERIDARIAIPVGETWHVSYDSIYEPPTGEFTQGIISLTKDLHCRTLSMSYDHVGKRVAFQYTINAFPNLPIGWDSAGGLSLFDLDDISDIVGIKE